MIAGALLLTPGFMTDAVGLALFVPRFRDALRQLHAEKPMVSASGAFDPARHRDYLDLYPAAPPLSRRVYRLFDRFARGTEQRAILERSARDLPGWIARYLQEGVP